MRERPRTCPSMRRKRLAQDVLISSLMANIYPHRVYKTRRIVMSLGHEHHHHSAPATEGVLDPVCGMTVDPYTTPHRAEHASHPYYFCAAGCRTKFIADPARYL